MSFYSKIQLQLQFLEVIQSLYNLQWKKNKSTLPEFPAWHLIFDVFLFVVDITFLGFFLISCVN